MNREPNPVYIMDVQKVPFELARQIFGLMSGVRAGFLMHKQETSSQQTTALVLDRP